MEQPIKILVVDDDLRMRDLLNRYLSEQGFNVAACGDGAAMELSLSRERWDLIVLDLMLPGEDGLSILRRLRIAGIEPAVIMLTAKGDEVDRIIGLEMGADDYLPKPFNPRELLARIKAVLRRRTPLPPPGAPTIEDEVISFGAYRLSLGRRELRKGDDILPITSGEFAVLKALVTHPRYPLSRNRLMELARGREHVAYDRSIDVQISRLRKLLEQDPSRPRYIQTVWAFGYVFVPDDEACT